MSNKLTDDEQIQELINQLAIEDVPKPILDFTNDVIYYMAKYYPDYKLGKEKFLEERGDNCGLNLPRILISGMLDKLIEDTGLTNLVQQIQSSEFCPKDLKIDISTSKPKKILHGVMFNDIIVHKNDYTKCMNFIAGKSQSVNIDNFSIFLLDENEEPLTKVF